MAPAQERQQRVPPQKRSNNFFMKSKWKWILAAAVLAGLFIAARMLPVAQWLRDFNDWVETLGAAGIFIYGAVYVCATVLLVPGAALTIAAGFLFGVLWGTILVSISSTLGAALAFLIGRFIARDKIEEKARQNPRFQAIDRAIGERGGKLIFLLRLSPLIPFNLSNYFYGLTAVKFWHYVLASWAGMLPGTLLYVYLGAAGKAGLAAASGVETQRGPWEIALFAIGLLATLAVTIWITKIARDALKQREIETNDNENE